MSRFAIGVDLGTTNSVLAFTTLRLSKSGPESRTELTSARPAASPEYSEVRSPRVSPNDLIQRFMANGSN